MDLDEQEGATTKAQEGGGEDRRRQKNDGDVEMDDAASGKQRGEEQGADKREGNGSSAVPATGVTGGDEDDAVEY